MELNGESVVKEWKKPLELFHEKEIVRICAPMVRYSKLVHNKEIRCLYSMLVFCLYNLYSWQLKCPKFF
jgi:hypothetical protein